MSKLQKIFIFIMIWITTVVILNFFFRSGLNEEYDNDANGRVVNVLEIKKP